MPYVPPAGDLNHLNPAQLDAYWSDADKVVKDKKSSAQDVANAETVMDKLALDPDTTQTPEQASESALQFQQYRAANNPPTVATPVPPTWTEADIQAEKQQAADALAAERAAAAPANTAAAEPAPTSGGTVASPQNGVPTGSIQPTAYGPFPEEKSAAAKQFHKAREPRARVYIGQLEVPITSLTLTHSLNSLPYAEFSVALDNSPTHGCVPSIGGVEINIENMNKLGRVLQQKIYNSFSLTPDVTIRVVDGDPDTADGQITFTGFLASPSFQVVNGQFSMVCAAMHSMARLQAFNPSIYQWIGFYGTPTTDDPFAGYFGGADGVEATLGTEKNNSIAQRAWVGLHGLMNDFDELRSGVNKPDLTNEAFVAEQNNPMLYEPVQWNVHALNKELIPTILKVMDTSTRLTEIEGLTVINYDESKNSAFLTQSPFTNNAATNRIETSLGLFNTLASGSNSGFSAVGYTANPDFADNQLHKTLFEIIVGSNNMLDALLGITQPFMFQMNAQWHDSMWLEHTQAMEIPQSMIVVPIDSLSFNLAAAYEIPLLQVVVRGPGTEFYAVAPSSTVSDTAPISPTLQTVSQDDARLLYQQSMNMFGRYPRSVPVVEKDGKTTTMPGRYLYVDAPAWICSDFQNLLPPGEQADSASEDAATAAVDNQKLDQDRYAKMGEARIPFLNYVARHVFNDQFLSRATARVRIPLCLTVQVGRTYFVKGTGQDTSIYIGHLQSVTHTISVSSDGARAETELTFSHVRSRSADLTPMVLAKASEGKTWEQETYDTNTAEASLNAMAQPL